MDRVKKNIVGVESAKRELISKRYKRITKAVNSEFWSSNSETAHSLYVGSYGRGTATRLIGQKVCPDRTSVSIH